MRTKDRELLQRIVDYMWEGELVDEIKELLAQPEQEPVAWIDDGCNGLIKQDTIRGYVIPLYLAPPTREPLSDKEITKNTPKLIHIGDGSYESLLQ